ncbi:exosortase/archaeosortase family protein [Amycolatopsis azurea DSM 43854]|uniref:Exosortase/archaeosortase family protein n=2 Tax=Amycolatopsis azurea TaxID=36819 RepID=A0ABX3JD21_9PSEU|nr:exosortase/archaeosortase family protein [Amycolatopsis azurea DSM 43854]
MPGSSRFPLRMAVLAVIAVAVGLVLAERLYRVFEVQLSGLILRVITSSGVYVASERETVYFGLSGDTPLGLRMTPECSSAFMLLPLLLVTAVMLYFRPRNAKRLFVSLAISAAVVILVNQMRVLAIVGLVHVMGIDEGYYWGHTLLGSMVSVLGGAVALVLFVWLGTRKPRAEREAV